jgi:succinate-acetate transporter protein
VNVNAAGELALAIAVIGIGSLQLGFVKAPESVLALGIWIACGSLVHFAVGIGCMIKGLNTNANAFVLFAAFLMLAAGIEFILQGTGVATPENHVSTINGFMWIPIWFAVWFWTISVLKEAPLVFIICVFGLDIAFPLTSLLNLHVLSGSGWHTLAGVALWVSGIMTTYMGGGTVVNATFKRSIFPMGKPLIHG